jgi:hypothetical protein
MLSNSLDVKKKGVVMNFADETWQERRIDQLNAEKVAYPSCGSK